VAPTALTVFSGRADAPTSLCSINLEAKQGTAGAEGNYEEMGGGIEPAKRHVVP